MTELRVGTFNIHHGAPPGRWYSRRSLVAACRAVDADVLALQEVDHHAARSLFSNQLRSVEHATGLRAHFAATQHLGPLGRYGLALLTRPPMVEVEVVELPPSAERRLAIVARIELDDGTLVTVAATHLQNDEPVALRQLDALLGHLASCDGPVLVMGDFNSGPAVVEPRLGRHGFSAAPSAPTFPARRPRERIDWIAGRGLALEPATVIDAAASDHLPLVTTARVGSPPYLSS